MSYAYKPLHDETMSVKPRRVRATSRRRYCVILIAGSVALVLAFCLTWKYKIASTSNTHDRFLADSRVTPCFLPAGHLAIDQLLRYKNSNLSQYDPSPSIDYRVTNAITAGCARVYLDEYRHEKAFRSGGTTFLAHSASAGNFRLAACPIKDHFNGSYEVFCPFYGDCLNVSISLYSHDFGAFVYSQRGQPANRLIWNGVLCSPTDTPEIGASSAQFTGWMKVVGAKGSKNGALGNTYSWTENGTTTDDFYDTDIRRCLQSTVRSVTVIGDSHLRFVAYYLLDTLGLLTVDLAKSKASNVTNLGNVRYFVAKYAENFSQAIDNFLLTTKQGLSDYTELTASDVVLLNSGSWDLAFRGLHAYVENGVGQVKAALARLRWGQKGATLAWFHMPPYPHLPGSLEKIGSRSHAAISAVNAIVDQVIGGSVDVKIDSFSMSIARYQESVDKIHYLNGTSGVVGKSMVRKLMKIICNH